MPALARCNGGMRDVKKVVFDVPVIVTKKVKNEKNSTHGFDLRFGLSGVDFSLRVRYEGVRAGGSIFDVF